MKNLRKKHYDWFLYLNETDEYNLNNQNREDYIARHADPVEASRNFDRMMSMEKTRIENLRAHIDMLGAKT